MLDTLMVLWNQGHLKKFAKILFTPALITMSIALLVVIAGGPLRTLLSHSDTEAQAGQNQHTATSTEEASTSLVSDATATLAPTAAPTTQAPTVVPTVAPAVVSIIKPVLCNLPGTPPPSTSVTGGRVPVASPTARATTPIHRPDLTPQTTAVAPAPTSTPVVTPTEVSVTPTPPFPPIVDTPAPAATPTDAPPDSPIATPVVPTPPFGPFPKATPGTPDKTLGISNALTAVAQTPTVMVPTATPTLTPPPAVTPVPGATLVPAPGSLVRIGESLADSMQDAGVSHQLCGAQP